MKYLLEVRMGQMKYLLEVRMGQMKYLLEVRMGTNDVPTGSKNGDK